MILTVIDCDSYIGIYDENKLIFEGSAHTSAFEILSLVHLHKVEMFGQFEVCAKWYDSTGYQLPTDLSEVRLSLDEESLPFYVYLEKAGY